MTFIVNQCKNGWIVSRDIINGPNGIYRYQDMYIAANTEEICLILKSFEMDDNKYVKVIEKYSNSVLYYISEVKQLFNDNVWIKI